MFYRQAATGANLHLVSFRQGDAKLSWDKNPLTRLNHQTFTNPSFYVHTRRTDSCIPRQVQITIFLLCQPAKFHYFFVHTTSLLQLTSRHVVDKKKPTFYAECRLLDN
jgi:hypothetical protein